MCPLFEILNIKHYNAMILQRGEAHEVSHKFSQLSAWDNFLDKEDESKERIEVLVS